MKLRLISESADPIAHICHEWGSENIEEVMAAIMVNSAMDADYKQDGLEGTIEDKLRYCKNGFETAAEAAAGYAETDFDLYSHILDHANLEKYLEECTRILWAFH